jgi:predicted RNA-binding protein YlqC (UPF0109 family)
MLLDHPEELEVHEVESEGILYYKLRCNQQEVGKLVGKKGRTITAIRLVVAGAAGKLKKQAKVDIVEDRILLACRRTME